MTQLKKDGKTYTLKQNAYLNGDNECLCFTAFAKDDEGLDCEIRWEIVVTPEDFEELTDLSDACDWDVFTVRYL